MAFAINHPRRTRLRHTSGATATVAERRVVGRTTGVSMTGATAALVGVWGAIAVFVGPYFGFRPTTGTTWDWTVDNGMLHVGPGALALLGGLLLLAFGPARRAARGGALVLPALMLIVAGAWFVIGPVAWPTFESGPAFAPALDAGRNLLNQACASLAPGLVLAALGGMAMKASMVGAVVEEHRADRVEEPAAVAADGTAPVTATRTVPEV